MEKIDTTDWTIEDHIAWIREYADNAKTMARMVIGWQLDVLGTYAGTVEVVPWPEVEIVRGLRRRADQPTERPEGTRVIHANGFAYLVKDVI